MPPPVPGPGMRFGVDEAGKGPVLGSMFAAAVVANPAALPDDVDDSKAVPAARRPGLASEIREAAAAVAVAEVPVECIDHPETDMNSLTVVAHAEALAAATRGEDPEQVRPADQVPEDSGVEATRVDGSPPDGPVAGTVDAGDTDAERFGRRVAERLAVDVDLTAEHGADETDQLVGAASVVAKQAREAHVADLVDSYGPVGSGYPSDPATRDFLRRYVDRTGYLPACARTSWQTSADVVAAVEQTGLEGFGARE